MKKKDKTIAASVIRIFQVSILILSLFMGSLTLPSVEVRGATTGTVTASSLNIRKSPSIKSKVITKAVKGTKVSILGTAKDSSSNLWYKVTVTVKSKSYTGYASATYIINNATTVSSTAYLLGKVLVKSNFYKKADITSGRQGTLSSSQEVILLGSLKVNGINWNKIVARVGGKKITGYIRTSSVTLVNGTASTTISKKGTINTKITSRRIASTLASSKGYLQSGTAVTLQGSVVIGSTLWYKCVYTISGVQKTGYIKSKYITVASESAFEASISGFPDSYKSKLRILHTAHPNWVFKVVNTGMDWSTALSNETIVGRNTISSTVPNGGTAGNYSAPFSYLSTASGAYDWKTDTYTLCDGFTWYTASEPVVKYYMDPRNFLDEISVFQFESLAYDSSQIKNVVSSILSGTFMSGNYTYKNGTTSVTKNYADTFMTAGKSSGVSPYFLASRARQEQGSTIKGSVSGTYPGFIGYYNYFNIGANDSAGGGAVDNGLTFAKTGSTYSRPWTNPYLSIVGGGKYIGESYIQKGQNTRYFQKFSVTNPAYYYWHQYMTNIQAPISESKTSYSSYLSYNVLNEPIVFYIPVYKNMPSSICELPAKQGNPNSYLSTLKVYNGSTKLSFDKTFSYNTLGTYYMVVGAGVSSINVTATTVSSYSSIVSGTGSYNISSLTAGATKTINVICKAQNGSYSTYTIKVKRASN